MGFSKNFMILSALFIVGSASLIGVTVDPFCPYPSHDITFYPNPTNCSKYIECYEGQKYDMECPAPLLWNQYLTTCDYTCNGTGTTPKPNPDPNCPATGNALIPNYGDCTRFYECIDGRKYDMICPDGYAFSLSVKACEVKSTVDCSYTTVKPPVTTSSPVDPGCPATGNALIPNYGDCTKFFECIEGRKYDMGCPDGYAFSLSAHACEIKSSVDCSYVTGIPRTTTPTPIDPSCPASGTSLIPNYGDCTKFFECLDGRKYDMVCPDGYAFSISAHVCEIKLSVDCSYVTGIPTQPTPTPIDPGCPATGNALIPNYGDCTKFFECIDGRKYDMVCPDGYAFSISAHACEIKSSVDCSYVTGIPQTTTPTPSGRCPDNGLSYLPNYGDCTKYFQCSMGIETAMKCPDGEAWSIPISACDVRSFVDCSYTTINPPTQTPIPNTSSSISPTKPTAAPTTKPTPAPTPAPTPVPGVDCTGHNTGDLLPHPTNCRLYIECDNGKAVTMQCAAGTTFNPDTSLCDYNDEQNCIRKTTKSLLG